MSPVQQHDTSAVTSVIQQRKQEDRKDQIQSWPLQERCCLQINGSICNPREGLQNTLEISLDIKINNFSR